MQIRKTDLYDALRILGKVVDKKATLQVLSCVHLNAGGGMLTLTATNLNDTLMCRLPCEGDIETVVPIHALCPMVQPTSRSDHGMVDIDLNDAGRVTVTSSDIRGALTPYPVEDFPVPPDHDWNLVALWPAAELKDALDYTVSAAGTDPSRPRIQGIQFEGNRMAATDGHRLHLVTLSTTATTPLRLSAVAAPLMKHILNSGDNVFAACCEGYLRIQVDCWTLESRILDEAFPPIDQVIPRSAAVQVSVDPRILSRAIRQVTAATKAPSLMVRINGIIELVTRDLDVGESCVPVQPISNSHTGVPLEIGVNSRYLLDALGRSNQVTLEFNGPLDPITLRSGNHLAVVMPMRV